MSSSFFHKKLFYQRISMKVVFHQRLSTDKVSFSSKVYLNLRLPFIDGYLSFKIVLYRSHLATTLVVATISVIF